MYQDPSAPRYPYQPQPGAPPQQSQPAATPYPSQYPYQPQSGAAYYQSQPGPAPYQPQYPYAPLPAPAPYPQQQYPYVPQPGPVPYPQQYAYPPQQIGIAQSNPRANRAMINGIISIVLSFITLFALVGYAGLITGTFAIIYGFIGLNTAKRIPGNPGRGKAIAGIVLGFAAWFLVIISFIIRLAVRG